MLGGRGILTVALSLSDDNNDDGDRGVETST